MTNLEPFKRGGTFVLGCRYRLNGLPQPITSETFSCSVRTAAGVLVENLEASADPDQVANVGVFYIRSLGTTGWPLGELRADIKITMSGVVRHSETIRIPVLRPETE